MSILSLDKQHHELQSVIEQLNAQRKTPSDNRRRRIRKDVRIPLWVHLVGLPNMPRVRVHTCNISVGGISFVSKRGFPERMLVVTQLERPGNSMSKLLLTRVRFCRYVRQGHFQIGAEFTEALDGEIGEIPSSWVDQATEAMALEALMKS